MSVHLFGIRHHGPGSARSLLAALEDLAPDCLLIEGPPDAEGLIPLAAAGMTPPVALLIYRPEVPADAVYYPFAVFSPEWQALQYGLRHGLPIHWMDLPQAHQLGQPEPQRERRPDPIGALAEAAGYADGERWWEELVEHRRAPGEVFAAIAEMMAALRADEASQPSEVPASEAEESPSETRREALREAWMRQRIRQAEKAGHTRIAVVCGAWHVPALSQRGPAKADQALLKNLPKTKVTATWIPWTHSRLSWRSGYGAGVASPGWYHHLWSTESDIATHWLVKVARQLRAKGQDVSSAHVIEAVRLAETLAALRDKSLPGLDELQEATRSVICFGDDTPLRLIQRELILGQAMGEIPPDTPLLPIQHDLLQAQKRLRLKADSDRTLDLDLRTPSDREKSQLLHRLRLLDVPWASLQRAPHRSQGSFHEYWSLRWEPELTVRLIEANFWGHTVAEAATARTRDRALTLSDLGELSGLLDIALLADLPEACAALLTRIDAQASSCSDLLQLLKALPPLVRVLRYGNVRATDIGLIQPVVSALLARVCAGLATACAGLNAEASAAYQAAITTVHHGIQTLEHDAQQLWDEALSEVQQRPSSPGLLAGLASRLRFDAGHLPLEGLAQSMSQALSQASDPARASAWLEGFLQGSGLVLVHHGDLLQLLDTWLCSLSSGHFLQVLPLLRRSISGFSPAERQQIGQRLQRGAPAAGPQASAADDPRLQAALPVLYHLLGVPYAAN
ncbi:MAG: DUF5682 family protein [Candidatus Sericytochromatia bacterium]